MGSVVRRRSLSASLVLGLSLAASGVSAQEGSPPDAAPSPIDPAALAIADRAGDFLRDAEHFGFSAENGVRIGAPDLKVPATAYRWAALLHEHAPGQRVVAPPDVSIWLPPSATPPTPCWYSPTSMPHWQEAPPTGTATR